MIKNNRIAITGHNSFIGSAIYERLAEMGMRPMVLAGDIRDKDTFDYLDSSFDYLFHFASPSSQVLFTRNPQYCIETTLKGFMNAADACKDNGVKLVYPSTGLLSQGQSNEYARCKQITEDYAKGFESVGIRIFATYGPGEAHKRDYASVPYLFAKDMVMGRPAVVFGNGEQKRDFIYIDDVVDGILEYAENKTGVHDLGSGQPATFNEIIFLINSAIGKRIQPTYVEKPNAYVDETQAIVGDFQPKVKLTEGIKKMIESMK